MARILRAFAFALSILPLTQATLAQELIVQARTAGPPTVIPDYTFTESGLEDIPANTFAVQAILVVDDQAVDVSGAVTWTVSDPQLAQYDPAPGFLTFSDEGTIELRADYGGLTGTATFCNWGTFDYLATSSEGSQGNLRDSPVPRDQLNDAAIQLVSQLQAHGIPVDKIQLHQTGVSIFDDNDAFHQLGIPKHVTDSDTLGQYVPAGFHGFLLTDGIPIIAYNSDDMIVCVTTSPRTWPRETLPTSTSPD